MFALLVSFTLILFRREQQEWRRNEQLTSANNYLDVMKRCRQLLLDLELRFDSDKPTLHANYFDAYAKLLCPWKAEEKALSILEFGIGGFGDEKKGGGDLLTWAEFFPSAHVIVGVDISKKSFHVPPNVKMIQVNQTNEMAIRKICKHHGPFDLIVDDASHMCDDTITTFKLIWHCLKSESIYILEDTQSSYSNTASCSKGVNANWTSINFFKRLIDENNFAKIEKSTGDANFEWSAYAKKLTGIHFYHNLLIITKG
ncbi:unnamed protein product [Toxocara canis]|uniref:Methyltransferase domain-containing protein n=1 Tax=Toxocara canis TaxID=6265 RepID=A0A3P7G268_TOXCA|nr:unnamed protein product [Toxocara canis]